MDYSPGIIIQARRGSSRLPDKVVRPFYKGLSILEILINRFSKSSDYSVLVATTNEPEDDLIYSICENKNIPCYRGSSANVLGRFYNASTEYNIDPVIRVCSDNPFLIPSSPADLLNYDKNRRTDYLGYRLSDKRIGIRTHFGLWAELISRKAMEEIMIRTDEKSYLEHVTNYLYSHQNDFRIAYIDAPEIVYPKDDIRLTIDSESDFELVKTIYEIYFERNREFNLESLILMIEKNPEWKDEMKKSIRQNEK